MRTSESLWAATLALTAGMAASVPAQPTHARTPVSVDASPLARTGGFGEPTCHECHFESELNPDGGSVDIVGLPNRYEAGTAYTLAIVVRGEGMLKGGFQLATRFHEGSSTGRQAGTLATTTERATIRDSVGVAYAQHTALGVQLTEADEIRWIVEWTAPMSTDAVAVHVAANSANGDDSPLGDWVFVREYRLRGTSHSAH